MGVVAPGGSPAARPFVGRTAERTLLRHLLRDAGEGRTAMVVGRYRRRFVHIPMRVAVSRRNQVDPHGDLWMAVLESTGQPARFG